MKPFHHDLRSRLLGGDEGWKAAGAWEAACLGVGVAEAIVWMFRRSDREEVSVERLLLGAGEPPEASR